MHHLRLLVLLLLVLSSCVVGPDGRRVLSPAARAVGEAMLEQVLICGTQAALGAAASAASSGGRPSEQVLLDASRCHLDLVEEQVRRALERARDDDRNNFPPNGSAPSLEHGRRVLDARELEDAGRHDEAKAVARECDRMARARLRGSDG